MLISLFMERFDKGVAPYRPAADANPLNAVIVMARIFCEIIGLIFFEKFVKIKKQLQKDTDTR